MFRSFKYQMTVLALGLSALFTSAALAQAAAAPATAPANNAAAANTPTGANTGKIAIVNIQEAISATNEGKKEFDSLQQRFSPKQAELKGLNDEVENMKKTFQTQSDKLSDEQRNTKAKEIEAKQKTLQRSYEDAQAEFQQAEQEVVNRIGSKMLNVLEKYAKSNGYTMVLDISNPQTPVLYASTNITKELVDAYNAEVPVAAPAARPATGAKSTPPSSPRPAVTPKKP